MPLFPKPNYASVHGDPVYPPEYLGRSKFYNFIFEGNRDSLNSVCDQWFNQVAGKRWHFEALTPFVILTFADYQFEKSIHKEYNDRGYVPYKEVILSTFVVATHNFFGIRWINSVSAFVPYIFLDNIIPTVIGRQMYGLPKYDASIDIASDYSQFSCTASTLQKYSPNTPAKDLELFSLHSTHSHRLESLKDPMAIFPEVGKHLFGEKKDITLPGIGLLVEAERMLFKHELPFTSLLQLRDIAEPEKASFQQILQYGCRMDKIYEAGLIHGEHTLSLTPNDFFPIGTDLGLSDGQKPLFGFWMDWEFSFEKGKALVKR